MTMSVGFLCSDGVVIGADRQVTNPSSGYTFHEQKLGVLSVNGAVRHIWSYAGNADTAKKLAHELQTKLSASALSKRETDLLLRTALKKCLKSREHFYTLFGTYVPKSDPVLWISSGLDVLEVERCEIIGTADSPLSRYFRGLVIHIPAINIRQASVIVAYMIAQAKKYEGAYCGGPTDIYFLHSSGHMGQLTNIENWEQRLNELEDKIGHVLTMLSYPKENEFGPQVGDIESRELKEFNGIVRKFCKAIREEAGF